MPLNEAITMPLNEAIAARINELLEKHNWSKYKLHIQSGLWESTISDIVNCRSKRVDVNAVHGIARAFDMDITAFFNSPLFENLLD